MRGLNNFYEIYGIAGEFRGRYYYAVIVDAFGNSLEEMMENVSCFAEDQDGEDFDIGDIPSELRERVERDIKAMFEVFERKTKV